MMFASTPPKNDDPQPWITNSGFRYAEQSGFLTRRYAPRPEYDRPRAHEANPVLTTIRDAAAANGEAFGRFAASLDPKNVWQWDSVATAENIEHARVVIARWLAVFA